MWVEARIAFKIDGIINESQSQISDAVFRAMTDDGEDEPSPQSKFKQDMKDILLRNYDLKLEGVGVQFAANDKNTEKND